LRNPSYKSIFVLYLPLALSWMTIVLEASVINAFLARGPEPEISLAAYGVAFSIMMVLHSPVIMILDVSVALSKDRPAFRSIRKFGLAVGATVTAASVILTFTPLCDFVLRDLMNIPPTVAEATVPILRIVNLVAIPIGWRRIYQGVLIRHGRTTMISVATGARLVVISVAMLIGQRLNLLPGGAMAALAMFMGVVVESSLNQWAARSTIDKQLTREDTSSGTLTFGYLAHFYIPLATTMVIRHAMHPVINAGIGAAPMSMLSLAAWPVALSLTNMFTGPTMGLQQLTIALAEDKQSWRTVSRFVLTAGLTVTTGLVLVGFTPLLGFVLGRLFGLQPHVAALAAPAIRILALLPLTYALQGLYTGLMVKQADTVSVRTAKTLNLVAIVLTLVLLLRGTTLVGSLVAAVAMTTGTLVETAWFYWRGRRAAAVLAGPREDMGPVAQAEVH
jgi:Na+-driven multidrug efflux pump